MQTGRERLAAACGIRVLRTPVRAPRANAFCERFIGSARRECLDHILVLGQGHLARVLGEYVRFFNGDRPHQRVGQRVSAHADPTASSSRDRCR